MLAHPAVEVFPMRIDPRPLALVACVWLAGCGGRHAAAPTSPPPSGSATTSTGVVIDEDLSSRQVFPTSNWWNLDIHAAPVDSNSAAYIDWISGRSPSHPTGVRPLHPDFG